MSVEDIIVDLNEIETIAHYTAAKEFLPSVTSIIDIGGQDMKYIKMKKGSIDNIMLNEACSSGCGSFIETFAKSLGISIDEFVKQAIESIRNQSKNASNEQYAQKTKALATKLSELFDYQDSLAEQSKEEETKKEETKKEEE